MTTAAKGIDRDLLEGYRQAIAANPELGRQAPRAHATWLGGDRCEVRCGDATIRLNGERNFSPMTAALAALAGCDVVAVAVHAALLGIDVEDIVVDAQGDYDARALLGMEGAASAGFGSITVTVRVSAPGATREQLRQLEDAVGAASQVGASLARAVPLSVRLEVDS